MGPLDGKIEFADLKFLEEFFCNKNTITDEYFSESQPTRFSDNYKANIALIKDNKYRFTSINNQDIKRLQEQYKKTP